METTKNPLPPYADVFFKRLSQYLDTPLYFFGSIQRPDYFTNGSDIDVDIFTNNETATLLALQNFLPNISQSDFKKVVWKLNNTGRVAKGYKLLYKENNVPYSEHPPFVVEFSIYNERNKREILEEHNKKSTMPLMATWMLICLKFCFYTLAIIPSSVYIQLKRFILNTIVGQQEEYFVVYDSFIKREK